MITIKKFMNKVKKSMITVKKFVITIGMERMSIEKRKLSEPLIEMILLIKLI
jgi:hypothetical protein